jgi:hypothetical protein
LLKDIWIDTWKHNFFNHLINIIMKANLKNYLLVGRFFLLGVIGAGLLTACSDDDDPEPDPVALVTPVKASDAVATPTSLTFSWQSVANAGSYSYVLKDASGTTLDSGTTKNTTLYFSGLNANSTYTLEVTAIPSDTTSYLNSSTLTLTGTTTDYNQLAAPTQAAEPVAEYDAIKFSWNAVDGASEYGYTLTDAAGNTVASGTTKEVNLYITNLAEGTTYTLAVTAKPSSADSIESPALNLTATTLAHIAIAAPQVSTEVVAARTVISWNAVENAEAYVVSYEDVVDTVTVTTANVDFLPLNTASTISVVAINLSDEQYTDSEAGTVTATRTRNEVSHARATSYTTDESYNYVATDVKYRITAYDDGSYTIKDWYGFSGYDLTFIVAEQGTGTIKVDAYNYTEWPDYAWITIPGANTYDGLQVYTGTYNGSSYAGIYGDVATSGGFWIWDNTKNQQFYITWEQPIATYSGTWAKDANTTVNANVNLYSDGIYTIENWYGYDGYDFDFTLGDDKGIIPTSAYYYSGGWYWVYTGPTDQDGVWIYTDTAYNCSSWDESGIWFYNGQTTTYWLQIPQ